MSEVFRAAARSGCPVPTPLSVSLGLSRNAEIGVWVGAALVAVLLAAVIWQTWPVPADDVAQPAGVSSAPRASAAPPRPDAQGQPAEPASTDASTGSRRHRQILASKRPAPIYEQKLTGRPNDPDLMNRLGQVLERMGRADEAAARFERAVALAPLEPAYRLNLARAAGKLGQWDRSINQYREAVRLRPKDYDALNALGLDPAEEGRRPGRRSSSSRRRAGSIPLARARRWAWPPASKRSGASDEAIEIFRQYLEIRPTPAGREQVKAHLALLSRGRSQVK